MNLEEAAIEKLVAVPAVQDLVGTDIGQDPAGEAYENGWFFRMIDDAFSPPRDPQGTSMSSIVLGLMDPWATPNLHNTATFPSLWVVIYADATRVAAPAVGATGLPPSRMDGRDRCRRIADVIDKVFHDAANQDHLWANSVLVHSCTRLSDLQVRDVLNGDGCVRGVLRYALQV